MKRILDLVGLSAGGWLGWALGAAFSLYVAVILSIIGTGVGLYAVRRLTKGIVP
jgi:hypothetical protein